MQPITKATELPFDPIETDRLTVAEVAAITSQKPGTLRAWRSLNQGPKSYRLGRTVYYNRTDVTEWMNDQKAKSTRGGI